MRRAARRLAVLGGVLVAAAALAAAVIYVASERRLSKRYDVVPSSIAVPTDAAAIERGEYLVRSVATCTLCHGDDAGGAVYADMGLVGVVAGPNLTRGRGGVGAQLSAADWVRAIRHGIRRDGTSMIVMPSEVFAHLSDADVGAIIAFLRQLPPVDRHVPPTRFGPLGRALLVAGRLNILVAPKTPALVAHDPVEPGATAEYGRYLADISGCHGCHGYGLSGGRVAGPPNLPPASNLTVAGIGTWTEADFGQALRDGRRPDGSSLDEFMPWRVYRGMSDDDVRALWLYVRSVPPREFGNK